MARWEPDARGRLLRAALELFAEQGYNDTTAAQIAERAGLTKTTLFRQFTDKREILFQGQDASVRTVEAAVHDAAPHTPSIDLLRIGLHALAESHVPEQREIGCRIDRIVSTSVELQERAAYKRSVIAAALQRAVTDRGNDVELAGALADVAVRAYYSGFTEWAHGGDDVELAPLVDRHFDALLHGLETALRPPRPRRDR